VRDTRATATIATALLLLACLPAAVAAQERPSSTVEVTAGRAAFIDASSLDHVVFGGAWRFRALRRLTIGPELVLMLGPGGDRDTFVMAGLTFDLIGRGRQPRVVPYLVAAGGIFVHRHVFSGVAFSVREPAFAAGAGARIRATDRLHVAPEFRVGWEPHARFTVSIGYGIG
jgi:hypothetical protein